MAAEADRHPFHELLGPVYEKLRQRVIPIDENGYILAWHFAEGVPQVNLLDDPLFSRYLAMIMPELIARREYVSTQGKTYQIITKNEVVRSSSYYYGRYKHREGDPWSPEVDWGTQIDLDGCKIDGSHRANAGGTSVNLSSEGRATYLCLETGERYVATVNSGDENYGWPHLPRGGGSLDSKTGLVNVGCARTTRFISAPDGQTCSDYQAAMPCKEVKIWVKTSHQQQFLRQPASPSAPMMFSARLTSTGAKSTTGLRAIPTLAGWKVEFPYALPHADYGVHITVMPTKFYRTWGRTSALSTTDFTIHLLTEKAEEITLSSYPDVEASVLVVL